MAQLVDAKLESLDALAAQIDRAVIVITRLKTDNAALKRPRQGTRVHARARARSGCRAARSTTCWASSTC